MTKKLLFTMLVLLVALVAASPQILAQTRTPDSLNNAGKPDARPSRESVKGLMHAQVNRADKSFQKLDNIFDRIQKRRADLNVSHTDFSQIDDLIDEAKTQQSESQKMLSDIQGQLAAFDLDSNPGRTARSFVSKVNNLKKKMIEFHKTLTSIVSELKKIEQAIKTDKGVK